jgi:hypothetical protein
MSSLVYYSMKLLSSLVYYSMKLLSSLVYNSMKLLFSLFYYSTKLLSSLVYNSMKLLSSLVYYSMKLLSSLVYNSMKLLSSLVYSTLAYCCTFEFIWLLGCFVLYCADSTDGDDDPQHRHGDDSMNIRAQVRRDRHLRAMDQHLSSPRHPRSSSQSILRSRMLAR